jgi:hypothetical protein
MPHVRVPRFFQPVTAVRSVEPGAAGATKRRERGVSTGQRPTALVTSPGRRVHARDVPGVAHHVFAHRDRGFARHRFGVSDPGTRACVPEVMRKQSRHRLCIVAERKKGNQERRYGGTTFYFPQSRESAKSGNEEVVFTKASPYSYDSCFYSQSHRTRSAQIKLLLDRFPTPRTLMRAEFSHQNPDSREVRGAWSHGRTPGRLGVMTHFFVTP